jgi:polyadenylate-binding protein
MNKILSTQQNILFLYDLPPHQVTSTQIAQLVKELTGHDLEHQPQIRRDLSRPFYTAVIKIDDSEVF